MSFTAMASIGPNILAVIAASAALASHWLFFNRGEHHLRAPLYFWLYLTLALALYVYELSACDETYVDAAKNTACVVGSYVLTLSASIIIYRSCFHVLLAFPGPRLAGVSKFWHVYQTLDSQNHFFLDKLHQQYGSFVRTGEQNDLASVRN